MAVCVLPPTKVAGEMDSEVTMGVTVTFAELLVPKVAVTVAICELATTFRAEIWKVPLELPAATATDEGTLTGGHGEEHVRGTDNPTYSGAESVTVPVAVCVLPPTKVAGEMDSDVPMGVTVTFAELLVPKVAVTVAICELATTFRAETWKVPLVFPVATATDEGTLT